MYGVAVHTYFCLEQVICFQDSVYKIEEKQYNGTLNLKVFSYPKQLVRHN